MKNLKSLYLRHTEIINYLIVGILTTIISLFTYFICVHTFLNPNNAIELQIANIISWFLSVIFAYITNRIFVFKSKSSKYIKEITGFISSRLLTLLMDMGIMYLIVSLLNINNTIGKLISQIVITIANYIFSKLLVFKK